MLDKLYENLDDCINDALNLSIEYAKDGVLNGIGGPFGSSIIQKVNNKYKILAIARNTVIIEKDPTSHAEINAIRKASRILGKYYLDDCILITTSKSCPMCISAACWARIPTVIYANDYKIAEESGFIDKDISSYIKGKNTIIKEVKITNENAKIPFELWNEKQNKNIY